MSISGTIGIIYVQKSLPNENGRTNGVRSHAPGNNKNMFRMVNKDRSCISNTPMPRFLLIASIIKYNLDKKINYEIGSDLMDNSLQRQRSGKAIKYNITLLRTL